MQHARNVQSFLRREYTNFGTKPTSPLGSIKAGERQRAAVQWHYSQVPIADLLMRADKENALQSYWGNKRPISRDVAAL